MAKKNRDGNNESNTKISLFLSFDFMIKIEFTIEKTIIKPKTIKHEMLT